MLIDSAGVQPQGVVLSERVMTHDKRYVTTDLQPLAELAHVAGCITTGKGFCPDSIPGQIVNDVRKLARIHGICREIFLRVGPAWQAIKSAERTSNGDC